MGGIKAWFIELLEMGELEEGPEFDGPENPAPQELIDAEERCPDVKFVQSCRAFFERRGFLSAAQRNALRYAGTPNRRRNYEYGSEPGEDW